MVFDKLHEECGVFGITGAQNGEAAGIVYNALLSLQHRGQESAGIAATSGKSILFHKNKGLVSEVFTPEVLSKLPRGGTAIGHVRYSTTGSNTRDNAQPIITEFFRGRIAIAHNGNIINAKPLRDMLESFGVLFTTSNDSEVISALIAYEMLKVETIEEAVVNACKKLVGAYSLTILSGQKLIAVRDPNGFRPLCLGRIDNETVFASETCALDTTGAAYVRDIKPGEILSIDEKGKETSIMFDETGKKGLCIFELVYFARPDSYIDNVSVYKARVNAGAILAMEYPTNADIVCGVPDSGLEAAQGYSQYSGIPLGSAFVKNRYIGRSFIFPSQKQREAAVRLKLNPLKATIQGKRVILVDDSIVRGTTCAKIIASLRAAGAKEVHLRISSPPFIHTCHFGTDIDSEDNLIANKHSVEEIAKLVNADSLAYISTHGLTTACSGCNIEFCTGCFDGVYPIDINKEHTKNQFEKKEKE